MRIEELVKGKNEGDHVPLEGASLPVSALRKLIREGYVNLRHYGEEHAFSLWGKSATACFTEAQIRERA